jgi:hypothetical protein
MADTSLGFRYRGRLSGGPATIQDILADDTATYYKGDVVNLESGEADPAVTTDANLLGVVAETIACTASTTKVRVITDGDAIYGVYDANARAKGATLDIAGSAGAYTIGASSNKELVVVAPSTASEETLVRFNTGKHHENVAQ